MTDQTEIRHDIGATGTLVLRTVSGSVRLIGVDGNDVVVTARSGEDAELLKLNVERGANRLVVEPRMGFAVLRRGDVSIDFNVELPHSARLELTAVNADVNVRGLEGEQTYRTVSGDLRLDAVGGRVTIQTISGDIRVERGKRLEFNGMTTSGDVVVMAETLADLRARTVSGDVRLTGKLEPGRRHSVETVSGDLNLRSTGGVTVEPSRALDIGRSARKSVVVGDGSAQLVFRSMSGEERVSGPPATGQAWATGPEWPSGETWAASAPWTTSPPPAAAPAPTTAAPAQTAVSPATRLDVLRALERGDIDVEEAARRLEEVNLDA